MGTRFVQAAIPDELYIACKIGAVEESLTMSELLEKALKDYIKTKERRKSRAPVKKSGSVDGS